MHHRCHHRRIAQHLEDNEIVEAMQNNAADLFLRHVCFQSREAARILLDLFQRSGERLHELFAQFGADATEPLCRLYRVIRRAKLQTRPFQVVRLTRATASRIRARASSPSTKTASPRSIASERSRKISNHSAGDLSGAGRLDASRLAISRAARSPRIESGRPIAASKIGKASVLISRL